MCGIFCSITHKDNSLVKQILKNGTIQHFLTRRGPDHLEKATFECGIHNELVLTQLSSVLQLRGKFVANQPYQCEQSRSSLQFNGQIFDGLELDENKSDTEQMLALLEAANNDADVLAILGAMRGPWSFVYWDNRAHKLWFGRDILGRRSLCWNVDSRDQILVISSVAQIVQANDALPAALSTMQFEELATTGVYCLDLSTAASLEQAMANQVHYAWNRNVLGEWMSAADSSLCIESPMRVALNEALPESGNIAAQPIPKHVIDKFGSLLSSAIGRRCRNHHNVCKKCFARYVKHNELAELENSSSGNGFSSDSDDEVSKIGRPTSTINGITFRGCSHASTAILFSGGIDSTVIAVLADDHVPENLPIDLLNVAFNDRAPDRETALRAWNELQQIRPQRKWNFVSILVDGDELERCREQHIKFLVKPSSTVLDDSIGCAVWFATRGSGLLLQDSGLITCAYRTQARVVLLGMGADEQLAGYSRHRAAFAGGNFARLVHELKHDVSGIALRNLGRDDRITSDHGIEARYPFLDEQVINFLNSLPVWHKANLSLERGVGEKLLLRSLAVQLELHETARHLKRAIQFGSRITMFNQHGLKGNDKSIHL